MTNRVELEFAVQDKLGVIALLQEARGQKLLRQHGLTVSQFTLLFLLGDDPAKQWTLTMLAQHMEMQAPGISKMVNQLSAKGYLQLEADTNDKRKRYINISKQGLKKRADTLAAMAPAIGDMFGQWSTKELTEFLRYLEKLRVWLDTNRLV